MKLKIPWRVIKKALEMADRLRTPPMTFSKGIEYIGQLGSDKVEKISCKRITEMLHNPGTNIRKHSQNSIFRLEIYRASSPMTSEFGITGPVGNYINYDWN